MPDLTLNTTIDLPGGAGMPGQPGTLIPYVKPNTDNKQQWPFDNTYKILHVPGDNKLAYNPLLIDLVDNDNQREYQRLYRIKIGNKLGIYKEFPEDKVKGYTLPQIEKAISMLHLIEDDAAQLSEFKELIKTVRPNTQLQKTQIDTLINKYIYYSEKYKNTL